jgi:hypothetical protein
MHPSATAQPTFTGFQLGTLTVAGRTQLLRVQNGTAGLLAQPTCLLFCRVRTGDQ